jgi:Rps23 Pro-64 3,4-dihydroxylase Tpa1-like proline 4-hydroxylase
MTRLDILMPQFEVLTRLAHDHLWVTTDELCEILRLEPRDLYDGRGRLTAQFDWRNFSVRQAKYAGSGQHFWEVRNRARGDWPDAPATPVAASPLPADVPMAPFVQLSGFMPPAFRDALLAHTLANQDRFRPATTYGAPSDYRRCLAYDELGPFDMPLQDQLAGVFAQVVLVLGVPAFQVVAFERQLTAYLDGCQFKLYTDASDTAPARRISFVYYFHRLPAAFTGGELILYGDGADGQPRPILAEVPPEDNSVVFFDSRRHHEVRPVAVPSGDFADSRFAVTGWLHGPGERV